MSQLVTQTTTYGLNSDQYSISTLSGVGGVLEIMAGNPHDEVTAPTPIADFKSDQSVKFYGIADLSNGVTLPEKVIGTKLLADKSVTSAKLADNVNVVGNLTGTASRAIADGEGNNIVNTYATKAVTNTLAPKASPTFTGTVTVPTPSTSDNSTLCASTAYVKNNLANYLPLSGGMIGDSIKFKNSGQIRTSGASDTYALTMFGQPDNFNASLIMVTSANNKNHRFECVAGDGTTKKSLIGKLNSSLVWDGKNIVRSVNGKVAGTDGNVSLSVDAFPSGTQLLFYQASAPNGWTKVTGIGDSVVKIVEDTSGGTTGGTNNFSATFTSLITNSVSTSGTVSGTSLSVAQLASHTHSVGIYGSSDESSSYTGLDWGNGYSQSYTNVGYTGSGSSHSHSFSGSSHSHRVNLSVKYINVIVCRKD